MGSLGLLLALTAATLNTDTVLRTGCDSDASEVASLAAGAPVQVRSSISGGSGTCYKVAATQDGKTVEGYVPAQLVSGGDQYDAARRGARSMDAPGARPQQPSPAALPRPRIPAADPVYQRIAALIESNEPSDALALADAELRRRPKDATLLGLAGVALYRADNLDQAILYWKESLAISPDPGVEALLSRALREKAADGGSERTVGARVLVRYERGAVPPETAQAMLAALDQEYSRISAELGCRAAEKVTAILQSREAYARSTNAAEWSGALYDGRIHVPVSPGAGVDASTRRALSHELVHACLAEFGQWPAWLQEGLAQKYSGESLPPAIEGKLQELLRSGRMPRLNQMGRSFAAMSAEQAQLAYAVALVAANRLTQLTAATGIRNVLRNPAEFARMTAEVERSLGMRP